MIVSVISRIFSIITYLKRTKKAWQSICINSCHAFSLHSKHPSLFFPVFREAFTEFG